MHYKALLGLGSNLDDPANQLTTAINSISNHQDIELKRCSSFYQSLPQGPQDQDLFINAVVSICTTLAPQELLKLLQKIESNQGKVKVRHWGERCIDLDILFIDQLNIKLTTPDLIVPHPYALVRDFVLVPALEIEPDWVLPNGCMLKQYLDSCLKHDLKVLPSST
tara:strand:- start:370 stop:867 length:498 start_codon:yes stop_codon:yes gene_type:complete